MEIMEKELPNFEIEIHYYRNYDHNKKDTGHDSTNGNNQYCNYKYSHERQLHNGEQIRWTT